MKKISGDVLKVSVPEDHLGYWLRYVSNNVTYSFSRKLEASNVTVAEWIILRQMYNGKENSPGIIAVKTGLTRGAVSKLIDRLLNKGLVLRETLIKDRRYQEIKLTSKGERLVPKLAQIADENDAYFFKHLSAQNKEDLMRFLKKVVKIHKFGKILLS